MEAASGFTYIAPEDVAEEFTIENVGNDLWAADEAKNPSSTSTTSTTSTAPPPPPQPYASHKRKVVKIKQADTNVMSINFGSLAEDVPVATGDAVFCTSCKAAFNATSVISPESIWTCEFCSTANSVNIDPEEVPKAESVDYILEPPSELKKGNSDNIVVFVIDISGSMCVSYEVDGKIKLKGTEKLEKMQNEASAFTERNAFGQLADQFLPHERRDITYVSRLQCVQAAIANEIDRMYKEYPNTKVGLLTFNSEVSIIGDGTSAVRNIYGDRLNKFDELLEIGSKYQFTKSIKDTKDDLEKKLFGLEEGGATALGPALVVAEGMCAKSPGAKIVICTDGLSNVGLGSLDSLVTDEEKDAVAKFYEQIGEFLRVPFGLVADYDVSIKGSDCSIENLGKLAELTSGQVDRVTPLEITKNFQSILSDPVVATHVSATIFVHKGLAIKTESLDDEEKSVDVRDIGNVTKETGITFEYSVKKDFKRELFKDLKSLPYQVQIHYRKMDGMKCLRVITKTQNITFDRNTAEEDVNISVLGQNAVQKSAKLAHKGAYMEARALNVQHKKLLSRTAKSEKQKAQYSKWEGYGKQFEEELQKVQQKEVEEGLDFDADEEDFDSMETDAKEKEVKEKKKSIMENKAKSRSRSRQDSTSNMLYQMKSAPQTLFK